MLWSLGADIKISDCTGYWQRQPYGKDTPIHKMDKIGKSASVEQKWGNGEESHARVKGKPGLEDHQEATAPRMWTESYPRLQVAHQVLENPLFSEG